MELKGSKTEANLQAAFAGESEARNKYSYYASKAKKDGYVQIANIFEETAANEKEHAKIWFKLLHGGAIPSTVENLKDAAEGDYTLKMERVVLATADEKEYYPADSESTVTVSTDTGINGITVDPSSVKIYDLQGRKVNKPTQGVYIVNGKKVVIK